MGTGPNKVADMIAQELLAEQAGDDKATVPPPGREDGLAITIKVREKTPLMVPLSPPRAARVREEVVRTQDSRREQTEPPPPPRAPSDGVMELVTDSELEEDDVTPTKAPSDLTATVRPPPDWDPSISKREDSED